MTRRIEDESRNNTRITRNMSRENAALAPNINNIVEFAMVGRTDELYTNPRNLRKPGITQMNTKK